MMERCSSISALLLHQAWKSCCHGLTVLKTTGFDSLGYDVRHIPVNRKALARPALLMLVSTLGSFHPRELGLLREMGGEKVP